jgi:hypothetical protein
MNNIIRSLLLMTALPILHDRHTRFLCCLCICIPFVSNAAEPQSVIRNADESRAFKTKYLALVESWAKDTVFTPDEQRAMQEGKQREVEMEKGPDDPIGKKIRAAGEPSFESVSAVYPGKILDRTVLGSYSAPSEPLMAYHDEFAIYWNGALAANLMKGRRDDGPGATGLSFVGHNTVVELHVGASDELFGRFRTNYSSIGYLDGYLPIVTATYLHEGLVFTETALAHRPKTESGGWDVAYVQFAVSNAAHSAKSAVFAERFMLMDGESVEYSNRFLVTTNAAILAAANDPNATFDKQTGMLRHSFNLAPGQTAAVHLKIPYVPDTTKLLKAASAPDFAQALQAEKKLWRGLADQAARIEVPEAHVNKVYRALLLQNMVLADGPRFTYGSGMRYNDSTYPQENGFAAHVMAMYGYKDYADQLQRYFIGMCATPKGAGRKYQNRRAMVLHHLLENYRLTAETNLFTEFSKDYYRIANEIVSDRHSTMTNTAEERPLFWGWLPPDKPGADVEASTQRVYVPGHNINNCQGLQDFGRFLVTTGLDPERGNKYLSEAADFRQTLMSSMERATIHLADRPPFLDLQTLLFRDTPDYGPEPYDDLALGRLQGTYSHYWVDMEFHYNFFNGTDPIARWLADYCRQRNGFVLGLCRARRQTNQPYGWVNNVYDGGYYNYRLRAGEVQEFIYGLYARLAFGMSRYTYVASEGSPFIRYNTELGGYVGSDYSFPNSAANADTLHMLRNALVYEELTNNIETGTLFLLKGAPRAWLAPGKQIRVERMNTYFGDITFSINSDEKRVLAHITPPKGKWRNMEIALAIPGKAPTKVMVNGKAQSNQGGNIRIVSGASAYDVEVEY